MISSFRGDHAFLSNFHPSPVAFEGDTYPTVEHAFQAAKSLDPEVRRRIGSAPTPAAAKARGKRCELRPDWERVKLGVMEACLRAKFADPALRARLLATGDEELVEENRWNDRYWGTCRGKGQNHLGKLLMKIRGEIRRDGPGTPGEGGR